MKNTLAALVSGCLLVAAPIAWAAKPELAGKTVPSDQNNDKKPEHWETYDSRGVKVLVAGDTNADGKADYWKHPIRGMMILREKDRNFDGKVDERSITDFMYDKALKFNRHLYIWRESDDDYDGAIDVYKVRGTAKPDPDRKGQRIDVAPWSESKEAALAKSKADASASQGKSLVDQMNARHGY